MHKATPGDSQTWRFCHAQGHITLLTPPTWMCENMQCCQWGKLLRPEVRLTPRGSKSQPSKIVRCGPRGPPCITKTPLSLGIPESYRLPSGSRDKDRPITYYTVWWIFQTNTGLSVRILIKNESPPANIDCSVIYCCKTIHPKTYCLSTTTTFIITHCSLGWWGSAELSFCPTQCWPEAHLGRTSRMPHSYVVFHFGRERLEGWSLSLCGSKASPHSLFTTV